MLPAIVPTTQQSTRATVLQVFGLTALVWDGSVAREAGFAGRLRAAADRTRSNQLAVGDEVTLEEGPPLQIVAVAPRKTQLERATTGARGRDLTQVIAANAEQAMIVSSLTDPPFRAGLIDRWTLLALRGGMEPVLCMNKIDLGSLEQARREIDQASIHLHALFLSAETGAGMADLRACLSGRSTVLVGHSGVGKSSLLRKLLPHADVVTGELSGKTRKGRHTTSSSRLYPLPEGGVLIDTPGVRSVVLGKTDAEEVAGVFHDIVTAPPCRFRPCTHRSEPGCTVTEGVSRGQISRTVYQRYMKLLEEVVLP
jgi:ribosome biogenesis GTPase